MFHIHLKGERGEIWNANAGKALFLLVVEVYVDGVLSSFPAGSGRQQIELASPLNRTVICFSHLRWDFVLQRPQHLMGRFAKTDRVFFFEEAAGTDHYMPYLDMIPYPADNVVAICPHIPNSYNEAETEAALRMLLDQLLIMTASPRPVLWFYTPMMFSFARHVDASAVIYDCMDELANFRFAEPRLKQLEADLMKRADAVFTGGFSLYEAKRNRHGNIHPFPSSVDVAHFRTARAGLPVPADQQSIPGPRLGFYGVIDERIDLDLIGALAEARPDWSVVMVGPVAKIEWDDLPKAPNIHYLGAKHYDELPAYLSGWDVALMPFAINEATRFISPTKTPEYLAAGRPVVSTPITDVVRQYGDLAGVHIAATPEAFIAACERALRLNEQPDSWLRDVDALLSNLSWDATFLRMKNIVADVLASKSPARRRSSVSRDAGAASSVHAG